MEDRNVLRVADGLIDHVTVADVADKLLHPRTVLCYMEAHIDQHQFINWLLAARRAGEFTAIEQCRCEL